MRFSLSSALVASLFVSGTLAWSQNGQNDHDHDNNNNQQLTKDTCGEVDEYLKVYQRGNYVKVGKIDSCLCVSNLPYFVATNDVAIKATKIVGKAKVIDILTDMIRDCGKTCSYPPHSEPQCKHDNPCSFTCKDGYTPYPSNKPTQCVCKKPYKECNGKCGNYHGCPSGRAKRDVTYGSESLCARGLTACGVFGWNARSWECLDTRTDLESCGGCVVPLHGQPNAAGRDCTAIAGVSDVSCVSGQCRVHRCRSGYEVNSAGDSCVFAEDKGSMLAAEYGLEHVPL